MVSEERSDFQTVRLAQCGRKCFFRRRNVARLQGRGIAAR